MKRSDLTGKKIGEYVVVRPGVTRYRSGTTWILRCAHCASEIERLTAQINHLQRIQRCNCRLAATLKNLAETAKAYMAGMLDGEGCISISMHTSPLRPIPRHHMTVRITNSDRHVLEWIQSYCAGNLSRSNNPKAKRLIWNWSVSSSQALLFLECVAPYVRIKSRETQIAIGFQNRMAELNGKSRWRGNGVPAEEVGWREDQRKKIISIRNEGVA